MIGDTPEQIKLCLSCTKLGCTNCLAHKPSGRKGRPLYPVVAYNDKETHWFPSVHAAAAFVFIGEQSIRFAIKRKEFRYGYYWRYDR